MLRAQVLQAKSTNQALTVEKLATATAQDLIFSGLDEKVDKFCQNYPNLLKAFKLAQ